MLLIRAQSRKQPQRKQKESRQKYLQYMSHQQKLKRQILLQQNKKMKQLSAGSRQMQRHGHSSCSSLYSR